MLTLLVGKPGAGKSLKLVKEFIIAQARGKPGKPGKMGIGGVRGVPQRHVLTNVPVLVDEITEKFPETEGFIHYVEIWEGKTNPFSNLDFIKQAAKEFKAEDGRGPLFVIDEAHLIFSKTKTTEQQRDWFTLHRHDAVDIVLATQQISQLNRDIAGLAEQYIILQRNRTIGLGGNTYRETLFDGYPKGATVKFEPRKTHDKTYFKFYESHFSKNLKEAQPKAKPIWMRWQMILLMIVVPGAIAYAVMAGIPAFTKIMGPKKEPPVVEIVEVEVPAVAPVSITPAATSEQPGVVETLSTAPKEYTEFMATEMSNVRSSLEDMQAIVGAEQAVARAAAAWTVKGWSWWQDETGKERCKAVLNVNNAPVGVISIRMDYGLDSITFEVDEESSACIMRVKKGEVEKVYSSDE